MSRRIVHDREFLDALVQLGLEVTSPEIRGLDLYLRHEPRRPNSLRAAVEGGHLFTQVVNSPGGGRLRVAFRDDGSTITLLDVMRAPDA